MFRRRISFPFITCHSFVAGAATCKYVGRRYVTTSENATVNILTGVMVDPNIPPFWPLPLPPPLPTPSTSSTPLPARDKPVLALDIDNTLIYLYHTDGSMPPSEEAKAAGISLMHVRMALRPYLKEFLTEAMQHFEVVFWTAALPLYAAGVIDAIERHVLGLPRSIYHHDEIAKRILVERRQEELQKNGAAAAEKSKMEGGTTHANFYCLCRSQTLYSMQYMKYLPLLGRPLHRTILVDDHERSFPLTPRNAVKVPVFPALNFSEYPPTSPDKGGKYTWVPPVGLKDADGTTPQWPDLHKEGLYTFSVPKRAVHKQLLDTTLLDLLPLLRALASSEQEDITKELDHWREPDYYKCDDFRETMKVGSALRQQHLGVVLPTRQAKPIPPYKAQEGNEALLKEADAIVRAELKAYDTSSGGAAAESQTEDKKDH